MNKIKIYTDGSSRGNPGPGGYGVILESNGYRKEMSAGYKKTTNNRMELLAVIVGFKLRIAAYILSAYSFLWAIVYFANAMQGQPVLIMSLLYVAITGGLILVGAHPENTGWSIDNKKPTKAKATKKSKK